MTFLFVICYFMNGLILSKSFEIAAIYIILFACKNKLLLGYYVFVYYVQGKNKPNMVEPSTM